MMRTIPTSRLRDDRLIIQALLASSPKQPSTWTAATHFTPEFESRVMANGGQLPIAFTPEEEVSILREGLALAYHRDPEMVLTLKGASPAIRPVKSDIRRFGEEVPGFPKYTVDWYAQHLGEGEDNGIAGWDPVEKGVIDHLVDHTDQVLRPAFHEHLQETKNPGYVAAMNAREKFNRYQKFNDRYDSPVYRSLDLAHRQIPAKPTVDYKPPETSPEGKALLSTLSMVSLPSRKGDAEIRFNPDSTVLGQAGSKVQITLMPPALLALASAIAAAGKGPSDPQYVMPDGLVNTLPPGAGIRFFYEVGRGADNRVHIASCVQGGPEQLPVKSLSFDPGQAAALSKMLQLTADLGQSVSNEEIVARINPKAGRVVFNEQVHQMMAMSVQSGLEPPKKPQVPSQTKRVEGYEGPGV